MKKIIDYIVNYILYLIIIVLFIVAYKLIGFEYTVIVMLSLIYKHLIEGNEEKEDSEEAENDR